MLAINTILADLNIGLFIMEMLLFLTSVFLMLLVLVQRGKGGGLTGALGGSGGSSAFGAKAGDAFTKITVYVAIFWIMLCILTIGCFNRPPNPDGIKKDPTISSAGDNEAGAGASDAGAGTDDESGDLGAGAASDFTGESGSANGSNEGGDSSEDGVSDDNSTDGE